MSGNGNTAQKLVRARDLRPLHLAASAMLIAYRFVTFMVQNV
jgi:hypothetical protein